MLLHLGKYPQDAVFCNIKRNRIMFKKTDDHHQLNMFSTSESYLCCHASKKYLDSNV